MLVLFDIDGTLLKSQHAGVHAMLAAFHQLHPDRRFSFDGVDIAGRLDTLIYDEMTSRHGVPGCSAASRSWVPSNTASRSGRYSASSGPSEIA